MIESFIVENYSGRVDAYIPKACPDLTRSRAAQLIADGAVLIDGKPVKASFKVQGGEKIDIIAWNENPAILIENALSPAKVISVEANPDEKAARVIVPDYQLSLAIGKEGQNARLAARLTGYKIDIKSETQARASGEFDDVIKEEFAEPESEVVNESETADSYEEETAADMSGMPGSQE